MPPDETFSVYSRTTEQGRRYTKHTDQQGPQDAVMAAKALFETGHYCDVWIVCDQDDMTVFQWLEGQGIVFPKPQVN